MAFGADHRPEVTDRVDIVELGEAGLGDDVERLAGRVREKMKVELLHLPTASSGSWYWFCGSAAQPEISLWKTMLRSLA